MAVDFFFACSQVVLHQEVLMSGLAKKVGVNARELFYGLTMGGLTSPGAGLGEVAPLLKTPVPFLGDAPPQVRDRKWTEKTAMWDRVEFQTKSTLATFLFRCGFAAWSPAEVVPKLLVAVEPCHSCLLMDRHRSPPESSSGPSRTVARHVAGELGRVAGQPRGAG
jgi:hypothetical protein